MIQNTFKKIFKSKSFVSSFVKSEGLNKISILSVDDDVYQMVLTDIATELTGRIRSGITLKDKVCLVVDIHTRSLITQWIWSDGQEKGESFENFLEIECSAGVGSVTKGTRILLDVASVSARTDVT